jgi:putative PIN family toxin of toxin-antitoxin system
MRLVLDTNVIVSALLKPASVPGRTLAAIWSTGAVVLYDARIEAEYRDVLRRPKFKAIAAGLVDDFLAKLTACGEEVALAPAWSGAMTDDDDRIFVEVALAGNAQAVVTGNIRDYPVGLGFEVHPPATLLALLE